VREVNVAPLVGLSELAAVPYYETRVDLDLDRLGFAVEGVTAAVVRTEPELAR